MPSPRVDEPALDFEYDVQPGGGPGRLGFGISTDCRAMTSPTEVILDHMGQEDRDEMTRRFQEHLVNPGLYTCTYDLYDGQAHVRRARDVGHA